MANDSDPSFDASLNDSVRVAPDKRVDEYTEVDGAWFTSGLFVREDIRAATAFVHPSYFNSDC